MTMLLRQPSLVEVQEATLLAGEEDVANLMASEAVLSINNPLNTLHKISDPLNNSTLHNLALASSVITARE